MAIFSFQLQAIETMQKTIHVDAIGTITLKTNPRSRNISIRIAPGPKVILNSPHRITELYARQIIAEKQQWIKKQLAKPSMNRSLYQAGDLIQTLHYKLLLNEEGRSEIINDMVYLPIPNQNSSSEEAQELIKTRIREQIRTEAKAYLPQRTAWLAQQFDFRYAQLRIKDTKSRWGSCSIKKNINLSLYLMLLPSHLIDYVILHELCHTIHLNHGKEFHHLMGQVTKQKENELRKELRTYRTGL